MKQIKEVDSTTHSRNVHKGEKIIIKTDDDVEYEFWLVPWCEYPIFSMRVSTDGTFRFSDSRNYNLPEKVEQHIWDEYGGYYMADGEVVVHEQVKPRRVILNYDVGDMHPLREPE